MKCSDCGNWITERISVYSDGSKIVNYTADEGKGCCSILNTVTTPDFGCLSFVEGDHRVITHKTGALWDYWVNGVCPECDGRGSHIDRNGHCGRCVGTGHVRYYEDGYIGEEKTRLHPKEKELYKEPEPIVKKTDSGISGVL